MTGPDIARVVKVLMDEWRKGHEEHLADAVRVLVLADAHGAEQVATTLAVLARRGLTPRPGEDFHRLEVFVPAGEEGQWVRKDVDELPAEQQTVLRLGVYAQNRDRPMVQDVWHGYVVGDPTRAAALLVTAVELYGTTQNVYAAPDAIEGRS